jgi:hypothetical protein
MKRAPLVAGSGQAWKITAGIVSMGVAAIAGGIQLLGPPELRDVAVLVVLAASVFAVAVLWWVRCPRCGRSLGVWAVRTGSLTTWHEELTTVAACPDCGCSAETLRDPKPGR